MEAIVSMIKMFFISGLLIAIIGIFCYVQYPGFRKFCTKFMMNIASTIIICSISFALAIIYIVSPIDIIPDPIPVLGQMDDLGVFGAAVLTLPVRLIYMFKLFLAQNDDQDKEKA